jgi:hypothetical protein
LIFISDDSKATLAFLHGVKLIFFGYNLYFFGKLGLFKSKENQPINRPENSKKAAFLFVVVTAFTNRINNSTNVIACHLNCAFKLGLGYLMRQTYQPFRTTILP